jgi:hypothetical protein
MIFLKEVKEVMLLVALLHRPIELLGYSLFCGAGCGYQDRGVCGLFCTDEWRTMMQTGLAQRGDEGPSSSARK